MKLAAEPEAARAALGLSTQQDAEVARNAELWTSPTVPALHRYTGVLYDALDVGSLRGAAAARARRRLAVGSALFGLLTADDPVPAYRLSAASALPGRGTLAAAWRPAAGAGARGRRRSGAGGRPALGVVRGAGPGARRGDRDCRTAAGAIVSHFNKAHKGGSRGCWWARGRSRPTRRAWRRWPGGRACTLTAAARP